MKTLSLSLLHLLLALLILASETIDGTSSSPSTVGASPAADVLTIKAVGTPLTAQLFPRLARMYRSVAIDSEGSLSMVDVDYDDKGSFPARDDLLVKQTAHLAVLDYMLPPQDFKTYRDLVMLPFAAAAIVPIINIAELGEGESIVLSREVLADIFQGKILHWDDPAIGSLNPNVALPPEDIRIVVPAVVQPFTDTFTAALSAFSPDFEASIGRSPLPNWCQGTAVRSTSADVPYTTVVCQEGNSTREFYETFGLERRTASFSMLPYAISFMYLMEAIERGFLPAKLINKAQATVTPSVESTTSALMAVEGVFDGRYNATLVNTAAPEGWPIAAISYLTLRGRTHLDDCGHRKGLVDLFSWALRHPDFVRLAGASGFAVLSEGSRLKMISQLAKVVSCVRNCFGVPAAICTCIGSGRRCSMAGAVSTDNKKLYLGYPTFIQFSVDILLDAFSARTEYELTPFADWNEEDSRMFAMVASDTTAGLDSGLLSTRKLLSSTAYNETITELLTAKRVSITPLFIGTIALIASLDNVTTINLTPELLADIYLGKVQRWNDAKVQEMNPGSPLPNLNITLVLDVGASEISRAICTYLSAISRDFAAVFAKTGNLNMLRTFHSRVVETPSSRALEGMVNSVKGALAAMWTRSNANLRKRTTVLLAGVGGDFTRPPVGPSISSMNDCLEGLGSAALEVLSPHAILFKNLSIYGCYPLSIEYNLVAKRLWMADAEDSAKKNALFMDWVLKTDLQGSLATLSQDVSEALLSPIANSISLGQASVLSPQPPCSRKDMGYLLSACKESVMTVSFYWLGDEDNRTCLGGQELIPDIDIACEYVPSSSSVGSGIIALIVICCLILIPFLWFTFYYRYSQALVASQVNFTLLFIWGALLLAISSASLLGENSEANCVLRPWALSLSFSVLFAPLLMKLKRVYTLFGQKTLKRVVVSNLKVAAETSAFLFVDVIILLSWQFGSKMTTMTAFEAIDIVGDVPRQVCEYGTDMGLYVMLLCKALVLGVGVYLAVKSWDIVEDYSEAKQLAIGLYNACLMGGLTLLLTMGISTSSSIRVILLAVSCCLVSFICVVLVMTPKLFYLYKNPHSRTSTKKGSTMAGGGGGQGASGSQPGRGSTVDVQLSSARNPSSSAVRKTSSAIVPTMTQPQQQQQGASNNVQQQGPAAVRMRADSVSSGERSAAVNNSMASGPEQAMADPSYGVVAP